MLFVYYVFILMLLHHPTQQEIFNHCRCDGRIIEYSTGRSRVYQFHRSTQRILYNPVPPAIRECYVNSLTYFLLCQCVNPYSLRYYNIYVSFCFMNLYISRLYIRSVCISNTISSFTYVVTDSRSSVT